MKLEKNFFKKLIVGVVLIVLAAMASLFLKGMLDSFDPENSLPQVQVGVSGTELEVFRAGYEWHYFMSTKRAPVLSSVDVPLIPQQVLPAEAVQIQFSTAYQEIVVSRADGLKNGEFFPIAGDLLTPLQKGQYVYRVEAIFNKGTITYYFAVEVI